jgi:hypothetical protein
LGRKEKRGGWKTLFWESQVSWIQFSANILLEKSVGRVRITDLGLARAIDDITVSNDRATDLAFPIG